MKTLNDIVPPSRRKEMGLPPAAPVDMGPRNYQPNRQPRFPYLTLIIVALIVAVSVGALFYFSAAKIAITPSSVSAAVQSSFTASKSGGTLPFEIISAQKIATQSVKGSGTETVNTSASGMLTIYNTQSKAQTLVANTRFATASGLIFRIHAAVTIPAGSESKPGTVAAKVFADKPGASYNVGPTSFTVPGFAGTPQASQVYARSTSAMTGGASGEVPVVDASVEAPTRTSLKTALAPDLLASLAEQVPSGYVLIPGSATTTFEELVSAPSATNGMVDVKEQGTIRAVVFPNAALAKTIADSVAGLAYEGEPLMLASTEGLLLAAAELPDENTETFPFTLAGTAELVYTVDESRIAAAVAGKTRSAAEVAISNYPEVKRAVITLKPFWRKAFPQDPSSIAVEVAEAQ